MTHMQSLQDVCHFIIPTGYSEIQDFECHLWLFELSWFHNISTLWKYLNYMEIERAQKFVYPHLRDRYVIVHSTLRLILSQYTNQDPEHISFSTNSFGKPFISHPGIQFNISYSDENFIIGVCKSHHLGVDVENIKSNFEFEKIAQQQFHSAEFDWLMSQPVITRRESFFELWTLKEAYVKALGRGLSYPLNAFNVVDQLIGVDQWNNVSSCGFKYGNRLYGAVVIHSGQIVWRWLLNESLYIS